MTNAVFVVCRIALLCAEPADCSPFTAGCSEGKAWSLDSLHGGTDALLFREMARAITEGRELCKVFDD